MMPMGFEYGWSRALDVVATREDEPERKRFDLSEFIAEVNAMKKAIPALNEEGPQRLLTDRDDPLVVLERQTESGGGAGLHPRQQARARAARGCPRYACGEGSCARRFLTRAPDEGPSSDRGRAARGAGAARYPHPPRCARRPWRIGVRHPAGARARAPRGRCGGRRYPARRVGWVSVPQAACIRCGGPRRGSSSKASIPNSTADAIRSSGCSATSSRCRPMSFATGTTSCAPS